MKGYVNWVSKLMPPRYSWSKNSKTTRRKEN
jgi:hypothetical protein